MTQLSPKESSLLYYPSADSSAISYTSNVQVFVPLLLQDANQEFNKLHQLLVDTKYDTQSGKVALGQDERSESKPF